MELRNNFSKFNFSGQYGEPIVVEYREYIPPPPLEEPEPPKNETEEEEGSGGSGDGETAEEKGECSEIGNLRFEN